MPRPRIDYSLYLVTGRELLPPGKDYYESLEESLQGGVTVVQVREKDIDTGEFIDIAKKTKAICDRYQVPVLINDRIDVHLAVGIHIGQSDSPLDLARWLVGPDVIIGQSVSSVAEAKKAIELGADYVGIGAVWDTSSKDLKGKKSMGPSGVAEILDVLAGTPVQAVAIGGIHLPNLAHLLHSTVSPEKRNPLHGVAVISDIVGSREPDEAARKLRKVIDAFKDYWVEPAEGVFREEETQGAERLLEKAAELMDYARTVTPLVHQITNNVVINDSANATLAVGASPIMATNPKDCKELSPKISGLLINFGTITDKEGMLVAGREANANGKPVVFDPVAVGATTFRAETSKELLSHWQPTVIKGNAAEIGALAGSTEVASRGVDSAGSLFKDPAAVVRAVARKTAAIVVLTGAEDYISDGNVVVKAANGHELLGAITGSGCMTGSLIATYCGAATTRSLRASKEDPKSRLVQGDALIGALTGVLVMTVAAEVAAARPDVRGPGTFRAALLDEMYNLRGKDLLKMGKVEVVE